MSFEKPQNIPEKNELPLDIKESEAMAHQGRESELTKVKLKNIPEEEGAMALKKVRKPELSTMEEVKRSRDFYNFIKEHPKFGKFVAGTVHFIAKESPEGEAHAYKIQKAVEGKRVDELSDEELYKDKEVAKQLLEFVDASIEIIDEANKSGQHTPDLYGDKLMSVILYNPRYSSNIFVADKPDANGQRVFLVDVNVQSQQLGGIGKAYQQHVGSKLQTAQLHRWKSEIEKRLNE